MQVNAAVHAHNAALQAAAGATVDAAGTRAAGEAVAAAAKALTDAREWQRKTRDALAAAGVRIKNATAALNVAEQAVAPGVTNGTRNAGANAPGCAAACGRCLSATGAFCGEGSALCKDSSKEAYEEQNEIDPRRGRIARCHRYVAFAAAAAAAAVAAVLCACLCVCVCMCVCVCVCARAVLTAGGGW